MNERKKDCVSVPEQRALNIHTLLDICEVFRGSELSGFPFVIEEFYRRDTMSPFALVPGRLSSVGRRIAETKNEQLEDLSDQLDKFLTLAADNKFDASLLELSAFDPRDKTGQLFFTLVYGASAEVVRPYTAEMEANLSQKAGRLALVPDERLYHIAYFYKEYDSVDPASLPQSEAKRALSIGYYNRSDDESVSIFQVRDREDQKDFVQSVELFCDHVVESQKDLKLDTAIVMPFPRPAGAIGRGNPNHIIPHKGGALFLFGRRAEGFKQNDFLTAIRYMIQFAITEASFTEYQVQEKGIAARQEIYDRFSHELRYLTDAMSANWIVSPNILFDVTDAKSAPEGKLGSLAISDRKTMSRVGILHSRHFLETLAATMRFWTQQYSTRDALPFVPAESGQEDATIDLQREVVEVWKLVTRAAVVGFQRDSKVAHVNDLLQMHDLYDELVGAFPSPTIVIDQQLDCARVPKNPQKPENQQQIIQALLLMSYTAFVNVVKYADPTSSIDVTIRRSRNNSSIHYQIANRVWPVNSKGTRVAVDELPNYKEELRYSSLYKLAVLLGEQFNDKIQRLFQKQLVNSNTIAQTISREVGGSYSPWHATGEGAWQCSAELPLYVPKRSTS